MTKYKYDYRKVYRDILEEEHKRFSEMNAPAGAMVSTGANSAYGNTGDGTSATIDQTSSVQSAKVAMPLQMSISKRKMQELLTASTCVKESCDKCNCKDCQKENGDNINEACMKHLKEFFGENFDVEEYKDDSMTPEQLDETILVSISKKEDGKEQVELQQGQDQNQAQSQNQSQQPSQNDPNLNGQIVVQQQK